MMPETVSTSAEFHALMRGFRPTKCVYLSGPMRGHERWNFPLFDRAAAFLRERGFEVTSPAEHDRANGFDDTAAELPEWFSIEKALRWDLARVCESDAIVLLPGWEESDGARKEVRVALDCGLQLYVLRDAEQWETADLRPLAPCDAHAIVNGEQPPSEMRTFGTGATRDGEAGKYDYSGFLSPQVLVEFAAYMHAHRVQPDGSLRSAGNWKKGIPRDSYLSSLLRHVMDLWLIHETGTSVRPETGEEVDLLDALGGCLFNIQGYWDSVLREYEGG